MNIMGELKRRNVFRVALLYLVTSWLIVQVAETVLPLFEVPDLFLRGIILLLAVGLVPALVFSWAFELTPDGLKREPEAEGTPETRQRTAARLNWATLSVVVLAVAVVVADRMMPESATTAPSAQADAAGGNELESAARQQDRTSIAVLPFANLSPDPAQEFFADGITEDVLTRLARTQQNADIEAVIDHAAWRLRTKMPRKWGSNLEYGLAEIELLRGNHEQALARLANAVQLGWRQYPELDLDILWDPVRDDPRFGALAGKVDQDLAAQRTELAPERGAAAMPGTSGRSDLP